MRLVEQHAVGSCSDSSSSSNDSSSSSDSTSSSLTSRGFYSLVTHIPAVVVEVAVVAAAATALRVCIVVAAYRSTCGWSFTWAGFNSIGTNCQISAVRSAACCLLLELRGPFKLAELKKDVGTPSRGASLKTQLVRARTERRGVEIVPTRAVGHG
jgi:hypothetical protein